MVRILSPSAHRIGSLTAVPTTLGNAPQTKVWGIIHNDIRNIPHLPAPAPYGAGPAGLPAEGGQAGTSVWGSTTIPFQID